MSQESEILKLALDASREYLESLCERRVFPSSDAIKALEKFGIPIPQQGHTPIETIQLLKELGSPATTATAGGRFFGLVVGGTLPAALGAGWLATAWDQVAFNFDTSPISMKLEQVAGSWILDVLGIPSNASVSFVTGAASASLTCLAAARHKIYENLDYDIEARGLVNAPSIRVVVSDEIHITVLKALSILGIGRDQIERVPVDRQGRIKINCLPKLDNHTIVCIQAGNVNSGASDPFSKICEVAKESGAWVHIDGAFGLWAAASPIYAHLVDGMSLADSWVVDSHKWLNTPYDCGLAICRHPQNIVAAMATRAVYLDSTIAPKDIVPEFSRRARGVEVWAALYSLGKEGLSELIESSCSHAKDFSEGLIEIGYEVLNDVVLNQVVARIGNDQQVKEIAQEIQKSGFCWFGTTIWQGRQAIRISISSWRTTKADVEKSLLAIKDITNRIVKIEVRPESRIRE